MHKSAVKLNDVSHDFNFQKENFIYVTHKTQFEAVILLKMMFFM